MQYIRRRKIQILPVARNSKFTQQKSLAIRNPNTGAHPISAHTLSIIVNDRVLEAVRNCNITYGVIENDDMNSPAERRNSNLQILMNYNIGNVIGAPAEQDLSLALEVHHWELLMFLENPEAFFFSKYDDPVTRPDYLKMTWTIEGVNCGTVGYSTDADGPDIYPQTAQELLEDMGVVRATVAKLLRNDQVDAYAMPTHPGHHAGPNHIGGYCYLNNAAIIAHLLIKEGKSVGIIDVDYHGGNGTYDFVDIISGLKFVSIHAQEDYPETEMFKHGRGLPFGTTWETYSGVLKEVLDTMAELDIIIISLGFDTLSSDPLTHDIDGGGFELKPEDFYLMGQMIGETNQQILFIQEGGYDIKNIPTVCRQLLSGFESVRNLMPRSIKYPLNQYTKNIKINKFRNQ